MDVVISGASGLIGSALASSLERDGHRVRRLVRRPVPMPDTSLDIEWDPAAGKLDASRLEGADAIVHLAGAGIGDKRWTAERKRMILESRTNGTRLLAEAAASLDAKPSAFVSGSAMGIYGDGGDEVLTEASPPGDIFLSEVCVAWEAAAQPAVDAGIRVPFLRSGIVLSRDGGALPKLLTLFKLGLGGRLGSGKQWMSWISIDDEIAAIRWLIEHDVAGPVNLTAPNPVTNADFTKVLAGVVHRPAVLPVPAFGPKLLLGSELAEQLLFLSSRVEPTVLEAQGFPFKHRDLDAALRAVLAKN
jgi:uncharacterized protein (TIGR01777 family)